MSTTSIIGLVFSCLGLIILAWDQNKSAEKIQSLSEENIVKSDSIKKIISGDGFPHIEIRKLGDNNNYLFYIQNSFDFPIHGIGIEIFDYGKIISKTKEGNSISLEDYAGAIIFKQELSELPPKSEQYSFKKISVEPAQFFIKILSRNKMVTQKIVIVKSHNHFFAGYIIIDKKDEILKELIYNNPPDSIQIEIRSKLNSIPNNLNLIFSH